jgi:hypothetical protein
MTTPRPYRKPVSAAAAREELTRCAGTQFDPAIVRVFLNVSIRRLWWRIGPAAWLAEVPLIGWVPLVAQRAAVGVGQLVPATAVAAGVPAMSLVSGPQPAVSDSPAPPPATAPAASSPTSPAEPASSDQGPSAGSAPQGAPRPHLVVPDASQAADPAPTTTRPAGGPDTPSTSASGATTTTGPPSSPPSGYPIPTKPPPPRTSPPSTTTTTTRSPPPPTTTRPTAPTRR